MSKRKSSRLKSQIRELVPTIFALLIFVVPLIVYMAVFPMLGPVNALLGGIGAYFIILGICIIIWWTGRSKQ